MTKITVDKDLIEQAISALADTQTDGESPQWDIEKAAYDALRAALAEPAVEPSSPSPTAGMNIAQRILHVGGRNNAAGYVEFGSIQAVEALVRQVLRDPPPAEVPLLSDFEVSDIFQKSNKPGSSHGDFARAIEQAVRQKAGLK